MLLALRGVILGGERCDPRTLCGWVARRGHGRPRLSNVYGITETTVHVTRHLLEPADLDGPPGSPIGGRIPDLCTYVLDERMNPVPEGIPGELYVGGPGVTRGYLGRPALVAWRFPPDPYAGSPGARLCRTGDLVRRRPGGRLEFLGRVDDQVMIRGHRVEPGEVEAALRAQPGVRTAGSADMCGRPVRGRGRQVCPGRVCRTGRGGPARSAGPRGFLARRLPGRMVPGACVVLGRLPRTANGEVDRAALPVAEVATAPSNAPRSGAEAALSDIWADVLGLDEVGVHDDFLGLGGHSLLAVRITNRVRDERGFPLTVRGRFEHPTIEELGRLIGGTGEENSPVRERSLGARNLLGPRGLPYHGKRGDDGGQHDHEDGVRHQRAPRPQRLEQAPGGQRRQRDRPPGDQPGGADGAGLKTVRGERVTVRRDDHVEGRFGQRRHGDHRAQRQGRGQPHQHRRATGPQPQ
ncbi:hypothetical protein DNK48_36820 [Streptomyces malaysiensis subsp. malaysiensis]|nr:hypothetical protein DNK48_36820 [Streptomyces malaysiensis]